MYQFTFQCNVNYIGLYQFTFLPVVYKGFFSPHSPQHFLSLVFLISAILTSVRWFLIVILICDSSLMITEVEHLLYVYHPFWFPVLRIMSVYLFAFSFFGNMAHLAGSQFPDQGLNPGHSWKPRILTTRPPGNSPFAHFLRLFIFLVIMRVI